MMTRLRKSVSFGLILTFLLAPILQGCGDPTSHATADPGKLKAAIAKRRADAGEPVKSKAGARKGG